MDVSKFVISRFENLGIKHVFGIPGDFVLEHYKQLWNSKNIKVINNTDEAHSGFAADAYARIHGVGLAVLTYSVGASKAINAVQCAYAERSPLILLSGAPGINERSEPFVPHHLVRNFNSQKKMFDEITCCSVVLDNASTAGYELDRAIEALLHYKRPIYIELPRDVAKQTISYDVYDQGTPKSPVTDKENLHEAIEEISSWIKTAQNPVILAGVEISRYKLGELMVKFAERHNIPIAATLLSKSVVNERNPLFAGIYFGHASNQASNMVNNSDCLIIFGDVNDDVTMSFRPAKFSKRQVVLANVEGLQVKNHNYDKIQFSDFCKTLFKIDLGVKFQTRLQPRQERFVFEPKTGTKITSPRFFEKVNSFLAKNHGICADIGDSLFGASDLTVHNSHQFLSPAYYTSMGAAIPYALGLQTCMPEVRPVVIVGDGAFQMSCTELSTIVDRGLNPIVFVLNNDGYTTERLLMDGDFNNIRRWNYHKIVDVIGGGKGVKVETEEELEAAVKEALDSKVLFVVNVMLDRKDISDGLRKMTEGLGVKI